MALNLDEREVNVPASSCLIAITMEGVRRIQSPGSRAVMSMARGDIRHFPGDVLEVAAIALSGSNA